MHIADSNGPKAMNNEKTIGNSADIFQKM